MYKRDRKEKKQVAYYMTNVVNSDNLAKEMKPKISAYR